MKSIIIFSLVSLLLVSCSSNHKPVDPPATAARKHYQLATVEQHPVATTLKLPGQLAAFQEVSIFPKVNGYVKRVNVDIGSRVRKGELLMELEAPELEDVVSQAKSRYARSRADFSMDKEHYERLLEASRTAGAISPLDLSTARAKMEADSALSNAEKSSWQMQETISAYLKVIAPFDGVITERTVHPGALVSAEAKDVKPMLELKETSHLRLQFDVPEVHAGSLREGDTITFFMSAFPGKKMVGRISRRSQNVNTAFRSERVEVDVQNADEKLAPGMYADVVIESNGTPNALSVPRSAVVSSTERKYVMAVRNHKTVKIDVATGNETTERVEVFGDLRPGDTVLTRPNDEIAEGTTVE